MPQASEVQLVLSRLTALFSGPAYFLADAICRYEEEQVDRLAKNTRERALRECRRLMEDHGGEPIGADFRQVCRQVYDRYPESAASLICCRLRTILNLCHSEWKWRPEPPRLGKLAQVKSKPRDRVPTNEERESIDRELDADDLYLPAVNAARFAMHTGVRVSEACTLRWDGVADNFSTAFIRGTKTRKSVRMIHLAEPTKWLLASVERDSEFCFPGRFAGSHVARNTVLDTLKTAAARAGISGICMHHWRHAWASQAMRAKVPDKVAMEHLGQSTPSVFRAYQHPQPEDMRDAVERVTVSMVLKGTGGT